MSKRPERGGGGLARRLAILGALVALLCGAPVAPGGAIAQEAPKLANVTIEMNYRNPNGSASGLSGQIVVTKSGKVFHNEADFHDDDTTQGWVCASLNSTCKAKSDGMMHGKTFKVVYSGGVLVFDDYVMKIGKYGSKFTCSAQSNNLAKCRICSGNMQSDPAARSCLAKVW